MRQRFIAIATVRITLAAALLFCGAAAAACGGGGGSTTTGGGTALGSASGSLTLSEYFQRVQTLNDELSARLDALNNQFSASLPPDRALQVVRGSITEQGAIDKDLRAGLLQLQPPQEVKQAHQEAIDALTAFIAFSQTASDAAATVTSIAGVAGILDSKDAHDVNSRLNDACLALEQAASQHGATLHLSCGP